MSLDEVEENVRTNGSVLTEGTAQVATLYYVDPQPLLLRLRCARSAVAGDGPGGRGEFLASPCRRRSRRPTPEYADDILPVRKAAKVMRL